MQQPTLSRSRIGSYATYYEKDKYNLHWCGLNRLDEVELGQLFNLRLTVQKMD